MMHGDAVMLNSNKDSRADQGIQFGCPLVFAFDWMDLKPRAENAAVSAFLAAG